MLIIGPRPSEDLTYLDRAGAYGIILRGESMLLARTQSFLLPGGGVDPGECTTRALHREAREETGWSIGIERRLGAYVSYWKTLDELGPTRKIQHIFVCRAIRCVGDPIEPDHTPVWVPVEEAPALLDLETERLVCAAYLARERRRKA